MDNNCYLAIENEDNRFGLVRLSFIKSVGDYEFKDTYQKNILNKYENYFKNIQNSMTLYGVKPKTTTLKANTEIKKYFQKEMKKFFPSQKFISEDENGVIFTINYTQPLEILPFIKRWLPSIEILEPQELKDEFKKDLQKAIENL